MEKVYVSLGSDCGGAGSLRENGKKTFSFPFDWLVSFHSIHKVFENDFKGFLEDRVVNTEMVGDNEFHLDYNLRFFHRERIPDYDVTLQRRIDRLKSFLEASDKEMIFLRRSHDQKHHREMVRCGLECPTEIDDVQDMKLLRDILIRKYPNLKFKLNLFIQCPFCNKEQQNYTDEYLNIRRSTQMHIPNQNEEPWGREFANWVATI
jgi:hypothetical protein